jgi:hypothetical protein
MNKPTAAQLKDPQWWGVWASEDATHYSEYYGAFVKPFDAEQWVVLRQGPKPVVTFMDTGIFIGRPNSSPEDVQPAAPEWDGTGLPPVGTECVFSHPGVCGWVKCEVLAYHNSKVVVYTEIPIFSDFNGYPNIEVDEELTFRKIRSQAEQEREKVVDSAKVVFDEVSDLFTPTNNASLNALFNALYDAGMLRRADK